MSRKQLQHLGLRSLITAVVLTAMFGLGAAASVILMPRAADENAEGFNVKAPNGEELDPGADAEDEHEEEGEHVALTKQAYQNLELRMGSVSKGDFWKSLLVPGRVVEIPGQSNLSISAPVTGIVEDVAVVPGQTLEPEKAFFKIRITDESLIDAQSKMLELLTRQEVAEQEIERLNPLIDSGAVSGTKARDLKYELKQLKAQEASLMQELSARGMPQSAIKQVRDSRQLTTLTSVYAAEFTRRRQNKSATTSDEAGVGYSVETLNVHPGMAVMRGDALCTVAYHLTLYVEGSAFQDDLPVLERIANEGWKVTVETHEHTHEHKHGHHGHSDLSLDLLRIDNHVDEETQTAKFFLELPNQVFQTRISEGRKFEQWRFRPGQRLHLRLPAERWQNQITLPADAVAVDGPNVFVFGVHQEDEESGQLEDSELAGERKKDDGSDAESEPDVFIELEPVPVRLLYRDDQTVVIADDGQVRLGEEIALNNAYKLYLAMKMQSGSGGGHHHHDH